MKIRGVFLVGLLFFVSSLAYLQAHGAGANSASPARASGVPAAAGGDATCFGGSIAPGIYSSLSIAGFCNVDSGSITVEHNLTVLPGGTLNAQFGGNDVVPASDVTVAGNLEVRTNGVLVLGCEPFIFTCPNDPDQAAPTFSTTDAVGGNLTAVDALAVVVHVTAIGHNVTMSGGGGVTCSGT